jgi:glutathione S-transferase
MRLFYSPGACSLSPHIVLREAGRQFALERVDLKTHRTASGEDFYEINPKGYVPVLELDGPGSDKLTEGPAIVQYIADLAPETHLAPPNGTFARYHLQEWLNFISSEVHKQFGPLLLPDTPEIVKARQRGKIADRFRYISDDLVDKAYLMGETFTVADAYLFAMLRWCERYELDLEIWPNLDDYYLRVSQRPAVEQALAAEGLLEGRRIRRMA